MLVALFLADRPQGTGRGRLAELVRRMVGGAPPRPGVDRRRFLERAG